MIETCIDAAFQIIRNRDLTDELLVDVMKRLPDAVSAMHDFTPDTEILKEVRKRLEAEVGILVAVGTGLRNDEQEPWLADAKAAIDWTYWNSYKREMLANRFNPSVIQVLDEDTDKVLDECGNPANTEEWLIKGLVMGDVQSGKTANYCGLINKAADAGYKVIVLLTGMIEDLRSQTQERIDSGFVGRDSRDLFNDISSNTPVGAGRYRRTRPNVLTSIDFDFLITNKRVLGGIPLANIKEPVILVMKKNKAPLQNLINFLDSQIQRGETRLDLPFLLLDDEADNASVNSAKDESPATINKLIRGLLKRFRRGSYVAYTATPFANVFINPDPDIQDLFPSNFIYSLNAPTSYIGASAIFSEDGLHSYQLQDIADAEVIFPYKHDKHLLAQELPASLQEAVEAFLLSCAIRDLRKESLKHRSMLINVTRFTAVQGRVAKLLKEQLHVLKEDIRQYLASDQNWRKQPRLARLHEVWSQHYADCGVSWDRIRKALYDAIASVSVLTINQATDANDKLDYSRYKNTEKGRRVIAVGGLTLSRGLTLEGLCVSYFLRNSKAYDTLLQMGRWFGYRLGYEDICRVWMDPDVQNWFAHIADVVNELRSDVRRMHANRQPPSRFGIRVQSHPDALIVTAQNKMRHSKEIDVRVSFSEAGVETSFVPRSPNINRRNLEHVKSFTERLGTTNKTMDGNRHYWSLVPPCAVATLLSNLEISQMNMHFIRDLTTKESPILSFISNNDIPELEEWDVCMPQGGGSALDDFFVPDDSGISVAIEPRKRQFEKVPSSADYLKFNRQRVGEIGDEQAGLSAPEINAAKQAWLAEIEKDPKKGKTVPGYMYRRERERPLLTIHLVEPKDPDPESKKASRMMKAKEVGVDLIVAVSLSFPRFDDTSERKVVPYKLNKVALKSLGLVEGDDDDDED